jgi:serine/threonine protein kinase
VLKAGTMVNGYLIEGVLGAGAMALVYSAKNRLDQQVAIKVLPEQLTINPMAVKRFEREARLISQLDHPHIVRVLDFFYIDDDTTPCMVMQYLSGGTLTQHLQAYSPMPLVDLVDIIRQLAEALDYAHSLDIVHRDIKLDNVLLYDTGQVALSDFGLARALNETTLTNTGSMLGTPYYMSPEQIQPNRYPLDHRADLYALGIMSYVLTTGFYPFDGTDAASLLHQHLVSAPPVPTTLNPALPEIINPVLMRAIAKDPDTRYANALSFAIAMMEAANMNPSLPISIKAIGTGDTITVTPSTAGKSKRNAVPKQSAATPQPSKINRWITLVAILIGIGSLGIAIRQSLLMNRITETRGTQIANVASGTPFQPIGGGQIPIGSGGNLPPDGGGNQQEPPPAGGNPNLCSQPPSPQINIVVNNYMRESVRLARKDTQCGEKMVVIMPPHSSFPTVSYVGEVWRIYRLPEDVVHDDLMIQTGMTELTLGRILPGRVLPTLTPSPMP